MPAGRAALQGHVALLTRRTSSPDGAVILGHVYGVTSALFRVWMISRLLVSHAPFVPGRPCGLLFRAVAGRSYPAARQSTQRH
jgi:hypothetical protein